MKRSSQELKVGDSIARTVTTKADGTPAMLLPPVTFKRIDGLALYPAQPSVQDNVDRRTGALSATRIDEATYILERPGDYTLPPIETAWWNARENKIERTRIDAVSIHVADNPALRAAVPLESSTVWKGRDFIDAIRDHWLLTIFTLGISEERCRFRQSPIGPITFSSRRPMARSSLQRLKPQRDRDDRRQTTAPAINFMTRQARADRPFRLDEHRRIRLHPRAEIDASPACPANGYPATASSAWTVISRIFQEQ